MTPAAGDLLRPKGRARVFLVADAPQLPALSARRRAPSEMSPNVAPLSPLRRRRALQGRVGHGEPPAEETGTIRPPPPRNPPGYTEVRRRTRPRTRDAHTARRLSSPACKRRLPASLPFPSRRARREGEPHRRSGATAGARTRSPAAENQTPGEFTIIDRPRPTDGSLALLHRSGAEVASPSVLSRVGLVGAACPPGPLLITTTTAAGPRAEAAAEARHHHSSRRSSRPPPRTRRSPPLPHHVPTITTTITTTGPDDHHHDHHHGSPTITTTITTTARRRQSRRDRRPSTTTDPTAPTTAPATAACSAG